MFSSAQIEYARYWLYQMGLTKTMLPIPSSDYLLTESNLRNWSPVVYKTAEDMKKALRVRSRVGIQCSVSEVDIDRR